MGERICPRPRGEDEKSKRMKEEWKSVIGYEGLYEVSSCGQIKSLRKGALLTPHKINGYYVVRLCKNGKMKNHKVHRLVAIAFIPNPENKAFVDHIDTNRSNNRVENLRWVTASENSLGYGYKNRVEHKKKKIRVWIVRCRSILWIE